MVKQTELLQHDITIEYLPYGSDMPYRIITGNNPVNFVDPWGLIPFKNKSSNPVVVSGNVGPGSGSGPQVTFTVPPGGTVDASNPFMTPQGPVVSDVDFIDFNGDGIADSNSWIWPFGEKIPGDDK